MAEDKFNFEDLIVWQKAVAFAEHVIEVTENIKAERKHFRLIEQLEASAASIASNIAEGKGRYYKKEFMQFLYISRGSLFETITFLIMFNKRKWISDAELLKARNEAMELSKMISGLISSICDSLSK